MTQTLSRTDRLLLAVAVVLVAGAAVTRYVDINSVLAFVLSGLTIAALASLVGRSVDQLGDRLGAGATGVLQSALGNLPELFVCIFALRAGLTKVVEAAVIGSILGNVLLVLGLAFLVGGLRNGVQRFDSERARVISAMMLLAVIAMLLPSLAFQLHTPAASHERGLSVFAAIVLLLVFVCSVPSSIRRSGAEPDGRQAHEDEERWPLPLAVGMLAVTGVLAAFVSDWFIHALEPAIGALHISQAFAGLVIVAIAGNAVENVVGIQLAARNQADYALSVILNSPLQIALVLAPLLVLLSFVVGGAAFVLVFPPLLIATVVAAVLAVSFIIIDGESVWLEGAALVGVYGVIAASFWWG
ncbi:MAG TPA: calcium/proton exchanger [Mycobacteriales bacterium]|nr:calcium/proton exchanger [Mycobacteriales bacterium]